MAETLTSEQQAQNALQVEINRLIEADNRARHREMARLDSLKLAKEILVENARSKPVSERDITAEDVTAFAATLVTYVTNE
jgi:hypothetical protein